MSIMDHGYAKIAKTGPTKRRVVGKGKLICPYCWAIVDASNRTCPKCKECTLWTGYDEETRKNFKVPFPKKAAKEKPNPKPKKKAAVKKKKKEPVATN